MTQRRANRRMGFSLFEILVVLWAMSVALSFGAVLMVATIRADRVSQGTLSQLAWRSTATDQFRADVARAVDMPKTFAEFARGPKCLILRMGANHIVYSSAGEKLERIVRLADGRETRRAEAIGPPESTAVFDCGDGTSSLVTMRFVDILPAGPPRRTEIVAALGRDRL